MPELLHSMSHESAWLQKDSVSSPISEPKAPRGQNFSQGLVECDQACIILASGHCVTHCASMMGIIQSCSYILPATSSEQIPNRLWSIQTADAAQVYRPPMS
ncbi:hypothetical protein SVI_0356 [Shewanella violacea DSS12]|uniref:Uncharacterized protein n=2 Tax=Shewanella violacea TaxID=60217 RepID=D4ZEU7_SHEVD|nr:hypothetical protein SVI_0356 [Shewanella violacea DSS12]